MIVLPKEKTNKEVGLNNKYTCPFCKAQNTSSKTDVGWISCPMIDGKDICIGCCMDYQGTANSDDFENHPFFEDFIYISEISGKTFLELRLNCLDHQIEICNELLLTPKYYNDEKLKNFLIYLENLKSNAD